MKTDNLQSLAAYIKSLQGRNFHMLKINTDTGEVCPCNATMDEEEKMKHITVDVKVQNDSSEVFETHCTHSTFYDVWYKDRTDRTKNVKASFATSPLKSICCSPDLIESIAGSMKEAARKCKEADMQKEIVGLSDKVRRFYQGS